MTLTLVLGRRAPAVGWVAALWRRARAVFARRELAMCRKGTDRSDRDGLALAANALRFRDSRAARSARQWRRDPWRQRASARRLLPRRAPRLGSRRSGGGRRG